MDQVWWNHIIKAHAFLEKIVAETAGGNSILLSLPASVPWRNTLVELVRERLQLESAVNTLEEISCPEKEPGEYLLERFCKKETQAAYRYGIGYAQFLGKCQETALNDRYVWVSDIPVQKLDTWLDFVAEYQKYVTDKKPGIFILEVRDTSAGRKNRKGIRSLVFDQNITSYDKYAFCALASSETNCKEYLRPYLAEVVSGICGEDVELCAACVQQGTNFLKAPFDIVQEVIVSQCRSDGESYCFSRTMEDVTAAVWEVQLKYIFPLIENYRNYFIHRYTDAIKKVLPIHNSYGDVLIVPEDVEIGILYYLVSQGNIQVSEKEFRELKRYRDARNKLAHMNILENEEAEAILRAGKWK